MTLLERILATPCPNVLHQAPTGDPCDWYGMPYDSDPLVCTSRIAAAEGATAKSTKKPRQHRLGPQVRDRCDTMGLKWRHGYGVFECKRCPALSNFNGKEMVYSHDNGKTWTPGPDACPVRRP